MVLQRYKLFFIFARKNKNNLEKYYLIDLNQEKIFFFKNFLKNIFVNKKLFVPLHRV